MKIILLDNNWRQFIPIVLTCALGDLRMGMYTIKERWEKQFGVEVLILTECYLQANYQLISKDFYIIADSSLLLNNRNVTIINSLKPGDLITDEVGIVAQCCLLDLSSSTSYNYEGLVRNNISVDYCVRFKSLQHLISNNSEWLTSDYKASNLKGAKSFKKFDGSSFYGPDDIFVEDGAEICSSTFNASSGPIYIGKNAQIMEGCHIRGPFSLGEGSVLKMGTKIYGATSIGRFCTVGGELKNVIIGDYSNKAHDGYLGDSIIGSWCNLGAGTSNSNVKNNAGEVAVWNYKNQSFVNSGIKCGVFMGDYSKTAINTSLNTGSVIGVSCNVFGQGLSPKIIPNFSWGFPVLEKYRVERAINDIGKWMDFKQKSFSAEKQEVLRYIFENFNDQNNLK